MLNIVAINGRLVADPELRTTPAGVPVTSIRVAVDRSYKSQNGERQADFFDVVVWRQQAELVTRYFRKGDMIAINGSLQSRSYTDSQGNKRTAIEIVANGVHFCGGKRDSADTPQSQRGVSAPPAREADLTGYGAQLAFGGGSDDFEELDTDDELPF